MKLSRASTIGAALVAVSLSIAAPARAGNALLGGYGGPGDGTQAVLGATLLNGPSGGGGAGGGGSSGGLAAQGGDPAAGSGGQSGAGAPSGSAAAAPAGTGVRGQGAASRPSSPHVAGSDAGQPLTHASAATYPTAAVAATTLGLSGQNLFLVALTLVVLALTGLLTRLLARRGSSDASR